MKIVIPSDYVKVGTNIKEGDKVKLLDEGEWGTLTGKDGTEKKVLNFRLQMADGSVKGYTMNKTTQRKMIEAFGNESENWMNKPLIAHTPEQLSFGRLMKILVLVPQEWKGEKNVPVKDLPEEDEPEEEEDDEY